MSKLDNLINKLYPNGVEYVPLWELTVWDKKFNEVPKEKQKKTISFNHCSAKALKDLANIDGDVCLLSTGNFKGWTTEVLAGDLLNKGEILAIPSGGSADVKYYNGKFVDSGNILCCKSINEVRLKFIYYFLQTKMEVIKSFFRGAGIQHPSMKDILDILIPLPPIEIQNEIVRILDKFTELEIELEIELEKRKQQYIHYRNTLLDFNNKTNLKRGTVR